MDVKNKTFDEIYVLRSMFYLLTPSETYFKEIDEVPNLTQEATKIFFGFIFIEQIIFLLKKGRFNGRINDAVTSISAGMISSLPNFFFRELYIVLYEWCYENWKIYDLPWDSVWTYIIALLFVDMMYYWFHRAAHEVNLFWAAHQTHHSSEDYNFTTALRQSIFQKYTSWFFYLPLALFVRPSIFIVHSHMNLIYQFWIHTEVVDNIGPLEYILNTPSHHRVHHGRNPYCIDKNYAGVLIIWDRIFGTFEAEKKSEKIAYGLVHPIQTFDPTYIQIFNYQYLWQRFWSAKSLTEKFSVLFKGPGWVPGSPRLGFPGDIPQVENPIRKYDVKSSSILNVYVGLHFAFLVIFFAEFVKEVEAHPTIVLTLSVMAIIYSLTCFGSFFDAKSYAIYLDIIRSSLLIAFGFYFEEDVNRLLYSSEIIGQLFRYFNILSLVVMLLIAFQRLLTKENKNSNHYDKEAKHNGHILGQTQNGHAKSENEKSE